MRRNYNDEEYRKTRAIVKKRDGRKCQMPGCDKKRQLEVHHIKKWSSAATLRYEPDNMITLCHDCHKSIKGMEVHYEALFIQIVHYNKSHKPKPKRRGRPPKKR